MKRSGLVAAVVVVLAIVTAIFLLVRRGDGTGGEGGAVAADRAFVDDSLGVRMRIPDSPGWTLKREPAARPDGRVASALHTGEGAVVRAFVLPATAETTLDDVFLARQRSLAPTFLVDDFQKVVARVLADERGEDKGRRTLRWQAISHPTEGPDGTPVSFMFMWVQLLDARHTYECIGLVRLPAQPSEKEMQSSEALLRDVAFILQSFETR